MTMKFEQPTIFSMFGIEDEVETKKVELAKAAEARVKAMDLPPVGKSSSSTPSKPSEPKTDVFKVDANTIIRYAASDFPVSNYFSLEELENGLPTKKKDEESEAFRAITESDLRKKLEDDFPELVQGFTTLVYVKKKNIIIPMLTAKKKGNVDCMGTSTSVGVSLSNQKIPFQILADFIVLAKDFSDRFGTEVHADIYFDLEVQEFFMDIPKQTVTPVLVTITEPAEETAIRLIDRRYMKVMEIHSHHRMSARPSSIDDLNERAPILYAIVGRIDQLFPEISVRTFDKRTGKHIPLNPAHIFDNPTFYDYSTFLYDASVVEVE
jgi:hypothetical protein